MNVKDLSESLSIMSRYSPQKPIALYGTTMIVPINPQLIIAKHDLRELSEKGWQFVDGKYVRDLAL